MHTIKTTLQKTVIVTSGDLELHAGKGLTIFKFKGIEKFVFKPEELQSLKEMIEIALQKVNEG